MQIELSEDTAQRLEIKAHQAGFETVEAYLLHLVDERETSQEDPAKMPYDQWRERYWDFVAQQKSRNPHFDDSRESIYLGP